MSELEFDLDTVVSAETERLDPPSTPDTVITVDLEPEPHTMCMVYFEEVDT